MRAFVRANLDKRRFGIVEDLAHLPGGVGGHVDLVVCTVVAAGEADEFVDKSLAPFRRARQPELARLGDRARMIAEVARTSLPLPSWLIWRMGAMPATPRAAWTMAT
jgi:hypothetical protein